MTLPADPSLDRLRRMVPVWAATSIVLICFFVSKSVSTEPNGSRLTLVLSLAAPYAVACLVFAHPDRRLPAGVAAGVAQLMLVIGILLGLILVPAMIVTPAAERSVLLIYFLFVGVQSVYYREALRARETAGSTLSEYFGRSYLLGALGPIVALLVLGSLFGG